MILFIVKAGNAHVIVTATNREVAKSRASTHLGSYNGGPDNYIVTPLTKSGDHIYFNIALST